MMAGDARAVLLLIALALAGLTMMVARMVDGLRGLKTRVRRLEERIDRADRGVVDR